MTMSTRRAQLMALFRMLTLEANDVASSNGLARGRLSGHFRAALLQDLSYTSKTMLVSRGNRTLAVAADISAMVTLSLCLILTASVTMRSGLSLATVEAFAAIADGGACGTLGGMFAWSGWSGAWL